MFEKQFFGRFVREALVLLLSFISKQAKDFSTETGAQFSHW
jgi:cell division protein FtsL